MMKLFRSNVIWLLVAGLIAFTGCDGDSGGGGGTTDPLEAVLETVAKTWVVDAATLDGKDTENLSGLEITWGTYDLTSGSTGTFSATTVNGTQFFPDALRWQFSSTSTETNVVVELLDASSTLTGQTIIFVGTPTTTSATITFDFTDDGGRVEGLTGTYQAEMSPK